MRKTKMNSYGVITGEVLQKSPVLHGCGHGDKKSNFYFPFSVQRGFLKALNSTWLCLIFSTTEKGENW